MPTPLLRTWLPGDLTTFEILNAQVRDTSNYERDRYPRLWLTAFNAATIGNNSWTDIEWDGSLKNSEGSSCHNALSDPEQITILTSGVYDLRTQILWAANATGRRAVRIWNISAGASIIHGGVLSSCADPDGYSWTGRLTDTNHEISGLFPLTAGTQLKVQVWQNSGGDLTAWFNLAGSNVDSWFSARWVAPL